MNKIKKRQNIKNILIYAVMENFSADRFDEKAILEQISQWTHESFYALSLWDKKLETLRALDQEILNKLRIFNFLLRSVVGWGMRPHVILNMMNKISPNERQQHVQTLAKIVYCIH